MPFSWLEPLQWFADRWRLGPSGNHFSSRTLRHLAEVLATLALQLLSKKPMLKVLTRFLLSLLFQVSFVEKAFLISPRRRREG